MDREHTLDIVLEIRRLLNDGEMKIRWPSNEMLASSNERRSNRRGSGDEHDSHKEYEPGDDLRHTDWIASAAGDELIIKTFFEPKVVRFNVLLDVSPSMSFGTIGTLKSRLAALCAGCGILTAGKVKDRVSYVTFADAPVTIRKSQGASRILTDFLLHAVEDGTAQERSEASEGSGTEGGGLSTAYVNVSKQHRGVVLLVSDFVNMSEEDWEALRISGFKHDTIAVFVQDLRERELPEVPWPGASYSFEDFRGKKKTLWVKPDNSPKIVAGLTNSIAGVAARLSGADAITTRDEYRQNFKRHEASILERLESYGVKTVVVSTEAEQDAVIALLRVLANKR